MGLEAVGLHQRKEVFETNVFPLTPYALVTRVQGAASSLLLRDCADLATGALTRRWR